MSDVLAELGIAGIVPVAVVDEARDAVALGRALTAGGLPCVEITFRTAEAEGAISRIRHELPGMLVGAGTILNVEQVRKAVAAGASFIVSPGMDVEVIRYCVEHEIDVIPGVASPTDIQAALAFGLEILKFFPAEALGGLETLKSMAAPFGTARFIPTGGINAVNMLGYLSHPQVHACGGSWMVKRDLIRGGRFDEITRLTCEAILAMLGFSLAHVGINTTGEEEAVAVTKRLCDIFHFIPREGVSSDFAGTAVEIVKGRGRGGKGHIAIGTNSVPRAVAYLERMGMIFDRQSAKESGGVLQSVYFEDEIAGFAVHLLQN